MFYEKNIVVLPFIWSTPSHIHVIWIQDGRLNMQSVNQLINQLIKRSINPFFISIKNIKSWKL